MIAEIVAIGTELLMGQIADSDAQTLSRELQSLGIAVYHHQVVGDNPQRMREALALAVIMGYSYCKRFTWAAHLVLGLSLSIAPVGAYIALTGRFDWEPCVLALLVLTWCGGFDIIYALQDADYDRAHGLHSIPQRFSLRTALAISVALHAVSVGALLWFGSYCPQGALLWTGEALFVAILAAEHLLVTPSRQRNIGIAFGTLNGLASLTLALFVIAQLIAG